jgi:hypothetical protein
VDNKINKIVRTSGKTMARNAQYRIHNIRATSVLIFKKRLESATDEIHHISGMSYTDRPST